MNKFCKDLKLKIATWNFTSSGHGKSVGDSSGANVKDMCNRAVMCGEDVICAENVKGVVEKKGSKIKVYLVSEDDIILVDKLIPSKLKSVPKTMKVHQVFWTSSNQEKLFFRYLSCPDCYSVSECTHYHLKGSTTTYRNELEDITDTCSEFNESVLSEDEVDKYSVGEWIVVIYDSLWYPEIIKKIDGDLLFTKFMARTNQFFFWTNISDNQSVHLRQVLCKIEAPSFRS